MLPVRTRRPANELFDLPDDKKAQPYARHNTDKSLGGRPELPCIQGQSDLDQDCLDEHNHQCQAKRYDQDAGIRRRRFLQNPAANQTDQQAEEPVQQDCHKIERGQTDKNEKPLEEENTRESSRQQEFGNEVVYRYLIEFLEQRRNLTERLPCEQPTGRLLADVHKLNQNWYVAIGGGYGSH